MTNKSIRDYINLIENAQREGSATRTCPECDGSGEDTLDNHKPCHRCNGKGHIPQKSGVAEGQMPKTWHDVDPKLGKQVDRMSQAEKVRKGLAHPDTLNTEQVYKVVALDKGNALKKPTKMKVKASSIEDVFSRLAANDWYPLEINGVEVIAGKRLKQSVAEGTVYPNAEVIKSKNGKPVGEIYQDGNTWGCFHYRADRGADFLDSREDAIQELKLIHQENGRKTPDYTIKGEVEEQLEETTPEAIAKIEQLTRR